MRAIPAWTLTHTAATLVAISNSVGGIATFENRSISGIQQDLPVIAIVRSLLHRHRSSRTHDRLMAPPPHARRRGDRLSYGWGSEIQQHRGAGGWPLAAPLSTITAPLPTARTRSGTARGKGVYESEAVLVVRPRFYDIQTRKGEKWNRCSSQ